MCVLNRKYELCLGLEEVLYAYSLERHNLERNLLVADAKSLQLVMNLPITSKNKPQGNVLLQRVVVRCLGIRKGFYAPRVSDEYGSRCRSSAGTLTLFYPCLGHLVKWN